MGRYSTLPLWTRTSSSGEEPASSRVCDRVLLFGGVLRFIGSPAQRTLGSKAEKVHIGAGIDGAQGAIDLEAVGLRLDVKALGEDGLEDIAGGDVLLGAGDGGEKFLFGRAVVYLELALAFVGGQIGQRLGEALLEFVEALDGFVIGVGRELEQLCRG